jgi:putative flippase GtrA
MLRALATRRAESTFGEFLRYLIFGGVAFVIDFGCLVTLKELAGLSYLNAAAIGFLIGVTTIYVLSISVVFRWRVYEDKVVEFGFFVLCGVVGLGLNQLLMYALTDIAGSHYTVSKIVTAGFVLVWNFGSRKLLLFQTPSSRIDSTSSS